MRRVGLTQRMTKAPGSGEKRDCLAHDWHRFLEAAKIPWVALPNHCGAALEATVSLDLVGIVLTGGDDIGVFPERDATETALIEHCRGRSLPLIGVCRGMQMLHHCCGGKLTAVTAEKHVATRHRIDLSTGGSREVNSFHNFAPDFSGVPEDFPLRVTGTCCGDGVVEMAVGNNMLGMMWHPEREAIPDLIDITIFRDFFRL